MTDERVILCGQAPGKGGDPRRPLVGGITGHRLRQLSGLSQDDYIAAFDRCNVIDYWPGYARPKGDEFPMKIAREAAAKKQMAWNGRRVVFVGIAVAEAFRVDPKIPLFTWKTRTVQVPADLVFEFAVMPHASPINRFWNDPANVARARGFFESLLQGRQDGSRRQA